MDSFWEVVHGGTDAQGSALHDFSTNSNACGPCPSVVQALQQVDAGPYPDPHYTALREALAGFHGVAPERVVIAGSSSEFIHRITTYAVRQGATLATVPAHHYGDYAQAADLWGLPLHPRSPRTMQSPGLHWACEPSSPLGVAESVWSDWSTPALPGQWRVLDCAYRPLQLEAQANNSLFSDCKDSVWQVWTPNKALGLTGVRAAYAIAPLGCDPQSLAALRALAPSWVVGSHGQALLQAWVTDEVQHWLQQSLQTLQHWKLQQLALCDALGWQVLPGHSANYWVARWPQNQFMAQALAWLRLQGIKLRDCRSFGLPGCVRMGVRPPASQEALAAAWKQWSEHERNL